MSSRPRPNSSSSTSSSSSSRPNINQEEDQQESVELEVDDVPEIVTVFADFKPLDENQLCLQKGDSLLIISKKNADWWWAKKGTLSGYVPTSYITPPIADSEDRDATAWQDGEYFSSYNTMVVLDVGCGSGILSMFAVRYGRAAKVYAVEASDFAKQTRNLIGSNDMSSSIEVIQGKMESIQLPEQVDVIISEWMGTFLLFEWMIESVLFARDNWLKEDGSLCPSHASLFLVPCCAHNLYKEKVHFWECVYGFDFSCTAPLAKEEFFQHPLHNHVLEPTDCLADPQVILTIDMKTVTSQELETITHNFEYIISAAGTLHGFASWFQVEFAGFATNSKPCISLNTGPHHPLTHWKQTLLMMDTPIEVDLGDVLSGVITIIRNKEWRRHLRIDLEYTLTSNASGHIQTFTKQFPLWR